MRSASLWVVGLGLAGVVATAAAPVTAAPAAVPASPAPSGEAAGAAAEPAAAPDSRDVAARDLFRTGRYAEALSIYVQLYTETHHPTYLRNIGRCRQMMRQPGPAIDSFRSYLRQARDLAPSERAEIEGYIAEMQRLEASAAPAPALSTTPPSEAAPGQPPTWAPVAPTTGDATAAPAAHEGDASPLTHKWWFWTGIGALVIAGVIVAVAAGGGKDRLPCPTGAVCPP